MSVRRYCVVGKMLQCSSRIVGKDVTKVEEDLEIQAGERTDETQNNMGTLVADVETITCVTLRAREGRL